MILCPKKKSSCTQAKPSGDTCKKHPKKASRKEKWKAKIQDPFVAPFIEIENSNRKMIQYLRPERLVRPKRRLMVICEDE